MWTQDDWNVSCLVGFAAGQGNCPNPEGPDFDFASGANLFDVHTAHSTRTILGAGQKSGTYSALDPNGSLALGPVTVANGVVYVPSMAGAPNAGNMLALDARSGALLWQFAAGGSVVAGASIANNTIYWGSGYSNLPLPGFTTNNKFYAFTLRGH